MESGINAALTVALSWHIGILLDTRAIVALNIVQNAGRMGVREGKTRPFRGFYAPKKHFYECDGSPWVYV